MFTNEITIFSYRIVKYHEVGLVNALKHRWFVNLFDDKTTSVFKSIDFGHAYILLLILGVGFGLSVFIFIIENIIFIYENRRK